jgi:CDP-ribitol ribitolphosphotransferase
VATDLGVSAIALRGLTWQRVQLVIETARGSWPLGTDPHTIRLRHTGRRRHEMRPTGVDVAPDGDTVRLRFNVIQGHAQRPLEAGRWTVVDASGRAVAFRSGGTPSSEVAEAAQRTYPFPLESYTVEATLTPGPPRHVVLDIRLGPAERRSDASDAGPAGRRPQRDGRLRTSLRAAAKDAAIAVIRRTIRRRGRRVVFASAGRGELSSNLAIVHDRMIDRGLERTWDLRMLHRPTVRSGAGRWRRIADQVASSVAATRLLASADVIFVAGSLQRAVYNLRYDQDVRFVQLWHASGAFKTVGYSRIGTSDAPDPYSRAHKGYTHAIVASFADIPFQAEAFGVAESRVYPTGIPRMDRFFDPDRRTAGAKAARAAFPASEGRRTILFAPTYRGWARAATYDYEQLDMAALHAIAVEKDGVIIFKMHPFVRRPVPIPAEYRDRLIDGTRTSIDVNDLLLIVDLLITDYSSIIFEFSTLSRPMLFFAYDLDTYATERDFYVPFAEFVPGRIVMTPAAMVEAIRRETYDVEKVASFATRHFAHLDAGSTDRVIDLALGLDVAERRRP